MTQHDEISESVWRTSDGYVVRSEGGWGRGNPLGHRLPGAVEHEICEGESAVVYGE